MSRQDSHIEVPQHTGIHTGLLRGLLHPGIRRVPDPDHEDGLESEDEELDDWLEGLNGDDLNGLEEISDAELDDWVKVEEKLDSGWVAVMPRLA